MRLEGIEVTNPATGKVVPMFVSDYVLMSYGTGIVMGVPGHDQRDWDFATKFGLPIVEVVKGGDITKGAFTLKDDTGIMVNSGFLNGMTVKEAIPAMKQYAIDQGWGHEKVNYKLRDWVFSRQRYWGEPIPLVNCPKCGWVPVPEDQLPVVLPQVDSYEPTDDGESPLSKMTDWVNTTCPCCGGPAKRETDTMPQWAGIQLVLSCAIWIPHDDQAPVSKEARAVLGPRRLVQRRHGAHDAASAVFPLLAQVPVRHRRRPYEGAVCQAHEPRHDPWPEPALRRQRLHAGGKGRAYR